MMETRTLPIGPEEFTRYPVARLPITGVLMGLQLYGRAFEASTSVECPCINVEWTGAGVVWHMLVSDTGTILSIPDALRDITG